MSRILPYDLYLKILSYMPYDKNNPLKYTDKKFNKLLTLTYDNAAKKIYNMMIIYRLDYKNCDLNEWPSMRYVDIKRVYEWSYRLINNNNTESIFFCT